MKYQPTIPALITAQDQQADEQDHEEILEDQSHRSIRRREDRQPEPDLEVRGVGLDLRVPRRSSRQRDLGLGHRLILSGRPEARDPAASTVAAARRRCGQIR